MNSPLAHGLLVRVATLEQDVRNRDFARDDESLNRPLQMTRRRSVAMRIRRLRLPSVPMPRRVAAAISR